MRGLGMDLVQRVVVANTDPITWAQMAMVARNRASEASAAASSTTARIMFVSSERTKNIVLYLFKVNDESDRGQTGAAVCLFKPKGRTVRHKIVINAYYRILVAELIG